MDTKTLDIYTNMKENYHSDFIRSKKNQINTALGCGFTGTHSR